MAATKELVGIKVVHDALLGDKPADASHDPATCPLCAMNDPDDMGGNRTMTYTEEEFREAVDAAVAAATGPLLQQVEEFKAAQVTSETEQQLEELRQQHEAEKSELQSQLDEAVLQAETAKSEHQAVLTWLEEEGQKAEQAAEVAARKDERLAAVREAANFPDEYLESNADRWAAMSDEDFEARLGEYRVIAGKVTVEGEGAGGGDTLPRETALHASREGRESTTTTRPSAVKELFALRRDGVDVRTL